MNFPQAPDDPLGMWKLTDADKKLINDWLLRPGFRMKWTMNKMKSPKDYHARYRYVAVRVAEIEDAIIESTYS